MSTGRTIVVKAMVLIRRPSDRALLVSSDAGADGVAYERPLGGHVEHGERAADTVVRELREELGRNLVDVRRLGVIENLFDHGGRAHHEVVFVFEAAFADPEAYEVENTRILDDPTGRIRVHWRPADATDPRLVPEGIAEFVRDP